jgi:hypothetical protein
MVEEFLRTSGKWDEYKDVFLPCQLRNLAGVYDNLSEMGEEAVARAAVEANLGAEQRTALHRLPLHWRDRDIFLSLDGKCVPRIRRQAFRQCRKAARLVRKLLPSHG